MGKAGEERRSKEYGVLALLDERRSEASRGAYPTSPYVPEHFRGLLVLSGVENGVYPPARLRSLHRRGNDVDPRNRGNCVVRQSLCLGHPEVVGLEDGTGEVRDVLLRVPNHDDGE